MHVYVYVCMCICFFIMHVCLCVMLYLNQFSFKCINKVLGEVSECPVCKTSLRVQSPIHPNFSCEHLLVGGGGGAIT